MILVSFLALLSLSSLPKMFGNPLRMASNSYPKPFTRELKLQDPPMKGSDVMILQSLLARCPSVTSIKTTGAFDQQTQTALADFQRINHVNNSGKLDIKSATLVLDQLMYDGYKDDGKIPKGYKFKLYIPVHKDRNIETTATLYDSNYQVRYRFLVRTHGHITDTGEELNQLTTDGNTPTGLATFDLNSPEPNPVLFGPYPVVRQVKGLEGNVAIGPDEENTFIPYIRYGILLHTGEWKNWNSSRPMPNSNGCIHAHPTDLQKVDEILTKDLGVTVRSNPFGTIPYPYQPQGLLSIEQIDH
ncbi:uncharacterized protein LOC116302981 [Actinia tenebrosa]|uniref:Uncharacterized protein LOC116302981 n=1 Tax=Actinia tenebrosa TaxID=6105 RepID=A0A6P8IPI9_ACTTE|nr:uncharacterized protein LOC116302981 [Actinia tenebrosa]